MVFSAIAARQRMLNAQRRIKAPPALGQSVERRRLRGQVSVGVSDAWSFSVSPEVLASWVREICIRLPSLAKSMWMKSNAPCKH